MNAGHVKDLLEEVQNKGQEHLLWGQFLNLADNAAKKKCLLRIVTIMLTDEPVKRAYPLFGSSADRLTIGNLEANGLVQCEEQVRTCIYIISLFIISIGKRLRPFPPLQGSDAKVVDTSMPETHSPGRAALLDNSMSCGKPSNSVGWDSVHLSVSPLVLHYMLKEAGLMDPSELSVLSSHVDRGVSADKQVVDAMMLAIKLEAYAACGTDKVTLQELLRGPRIPVVAAGKRFLVPRGHLTVAAEGQAQASRRLEPQQVAAKIEECRKEILRSRNTAAGSGAGQEDWPTVTIGFVGVGNHGEHSLVVLVDEDEEAWPVIVQSKQTAERKYETVRGVLDNLSSIFDLPQLQPRAWADWQKQPWATMDEEPPAVACEQPGSRLQTAAQMHGSAVDSRLLSFEHVLHVHVSDGAFTGMQDWFFDKVLGAGHPWLTHMAIVSYRQAACYYKRIGDLKRSNMRKAVMSKVARLM